MVGLDEYGLSVARTRGFRLVVLAGAALVVIWVLGTSRLFNSGVRLPPFWITPFASLPLHKPRHHTKC